MQVLFSTTNVLAKRWQWEKANTHVVETSSLTLAIKFAESRPLLQDLNSCIGILLDMFEYFLLCGARCVYMHPDRSAFGLAMSLSVCVKCSFVVALLPFPPV